ncbi:MAG: thiamine pyrophosphate-dependent dehydrogenase E1 component subunit alpha [Bacillota bacterium]
MDIAKSLMLDLYRQMVLNRLVEEEMIELVKQKKIAGALHLGIGHEALSVGATYPLRQDDYLVFSHRGVGHCLAKGVPPSAIVGEFMGRAIGCSKGKGGVHLSDFTRGVLGISGSQGGNFVIATGAGLRAKMKGTDQVAACFFGEGTSNRGPFHEGVNMAAVWKLPVIFVCENDTYSFSTHQKQVMLVENVADRASAYGIPGVVVDGNDMLAVYQAVAKAVERARAGEGPTIIEGKTYRWRGHHEFEDGTAYRDQHEVEEWKQKCPIKRFEKQLLAFGTATEDDLAAIRQEVTDYVLEELRLAHNSPVPDPKELFTGVYANPQGLLREA